MSKKSVVFLKKYFLAKSLDTTDETIQTERTLWPWFLSVTAAKPHPELNIQTESVSNWIQSILVDKKLKKLTVLMKFKLLSWILCLHWRNTQNRYDRMAELCKCYWKQSHQYQEWNEQSSFLAPNAEIARYWSKLEGCKISALSTVLQT